MAKKVFRSMKVLESYLQRQIDDVLQKEMATHAKEEMMKAVEDVVYGAGTPSSYKRRGADSSNMYASGALGTGSLADRDEMIVTMITSGIIEIRNEANPSGKSFLGNNLSSYIVAGYGNQNYWWNQPRDFISHTVKSMKENKVYLTVMQDGLRNRGFDVV